MGRFFGRNVTGRIAINQLACGEGSFGVRETYDTYFFGIKTGSGNTRDVCFSSELAPTPSSGSGSINFNSTIDKIEKIAARKYKITKTSGTNWYRWTCKDDASKTGVSDTKSGAKAEGKSACSGQVVIDDVWMNMLQAEYEEDKTHVVK